MIGNQAMGFDDRNIAWQSVPWLEHVSFYIYNADEKNRIVDVVFKFAANQHAMLHQHKADYITLVLEGELRLYHADGRLKEIRPVGSYVMGSANGAPHTEGGGERDAVVFFSNRNVGDTLYEFIDEQGHVTQALTFADVEALYAAQLAAGAPDLPPAALVEQVATRY